MALPTNGTLLATSADRKKLFRRAAERIVQMVLELEKKGAGHGLLPREIVTADSIDNSMILDMAMGGSTNTVLAHSGHRQEAGIDYDMARINALSRRTPNICKVAPAASITSRTFTTPAGAYHPGRRQPRPAGALNLQCPTVTGQTIGQNMAEYDIRTSTVKQEALELAAVTAGGQRTSEGHVAAAGRSLDSRSEAGRPGLRSGRLHPRGRSRLQPGGRTRDSLRQPGAQGAVVKAAGVRPEMLKHTGPAVIFEAETEAYEGIVGGRVKAGDVVVIRYEGPRGGRACRRCSPYHRHQRHETGRHGSARDRWPIFRRHGRVVHRTHQPRGGCRRSHRAVAARRHRRDRHPGPFTQCATERR